MTMPYLSNCPHIGEGWCLDCVKELHDSAAPPPLVWTDVKPTEIPDDGRVWLVILDPKWCGEYGIEYHGDPVAVSCWGHKLKTTIDAIRINPEAVVAWMPCPIPHPADAIASASPAS